MENLDRDLCHLSSGMVSLVINHTGCTNLTATLAMSPFLSGAMVPRVAIWMPMEAGFEKPQRAYVAIVTDRSDSGSATLPSGGNCIKIGHPGKLILSKGKGLREVMFS